MDITFHLFLSFSHLAPCSYTSYFRAIQEIWINGFRWQWKPCYKKSTRSGQSAIVHQCYDGLIIINGNGPVETKSHRDCYLILAFMFKSTRVAIPLSNRTEMYVLFGNNPEASSFMSNVTGVMIIVL